MCGVTGVTRSMLLLKTFCYLNTCAAILFCFEIDIYFVYKYLCQFFRFKFECMHSCKQYFATAATNNSLICLFSVFSLLSVCHFTLLICLFVSPDLMCVNSKDLLKRLICCILFVS